MELNLSYNSLAEYLKLNVSQQNISLSELLNPLVTRAKLYSNPLFRQDMMANDKLVRWGKGMLRKTKQMATILATPTPASPRDQDGSWTAPQRFSFQEASSGPSDPNTSNGRSDLNHQSSQNSQSSQSSQSEEEIQIAPPVRHSSAGREEPQQPILLSRARSQDGLTEERRKSGSFLARLFKPKKAKDAMKARESKGDGRLPRRNSARSTPSTEASEPISLSFNRAQAHTPKPVRRSHKLYRSYSDDFQASENRLAVDGCAHDPLSNVLSEVAPAPEGEAAKRLWLNVNVPAPAHWVGEPRGEGGSDEARSEGESDEAWGAPEHHGYVSPPPPRSEEREDEATGEFVSLEQEEGAPPSFDFDAFMEKSGPSSAASGADDWSRDLVGEGGMRA